MNALRKWFAAFVGLFIFKRNVLIAPPATARASPPPEPVKEPVPPDPPDMVPLLAMDIIPPPSAEPKKNRHDRRVFERARRRHDKFVQPQGPQPIKHERNTPPAPRDKPLGPKEEVLAADEDDKLTQYEKDIVGEWIDGDGEEVLYEWSEFNGEFNFRDTILEQLDRYWFYLERMRKYDPMAYGFYRQIGATLVPYLASGSNTDKPHLPKKIADIERYKSEINLPPWFRQNWPAFGCIAQGTNPRDEAAEAAAPTQGGYLMIPKFMYFRRVDHHDWTVQPVRGGKCYLFTVWWDVKKGNKWGVPHDFPIHISDDGMRIRALKTRKRETEIGPWWDWRFPQDYRIWAKQYGIDAPTHIAHNFCAAVQAIEFTAYSMLRVEVSNKGGLTAVFGLSPRRTAYFFQDRDIELTENGRKRRIFHMVRSFVDKNGKVHPTQFRGLREFTWAGYHVRITVPGRDHFLPLEFNVPSTYEAAKGPKYLTEPEAAKKLKAQMRSGLGGRQQ